MAEIASAYVSLIPSARGFGKATSAQLAPQMSAAGATAGRGFGKSFLKAFLLLGVVTKATQFLGDSIAEARESNKVAATTEQIIKTTGGAAKITAKQVGDMSSRLSGVTGIDDEAIQTGANLLLTFKNVKNYVDGQFTGTFDTATALALDLSKAGFGSVDSAAKMLGKALNDPVKGVTALSRAGVTFTDQQKEQIKTLTESGNVLGAQNIILEEVKGQVGGVAEATATNSDKAGVALGNLKEQIGTALIPAIDFLAGAFANKIAPAISGFITNLTNGTGGAGKFGDFIKTRVLPVLQDLGGYILNTVVPAVREGLGNALEAGRDAFEKIRAAVERNKPELEQLFSALKKAATYIIQNVIPVVYTLAGVVLKNLGRQIGVIIDVIGFLVREFNRAKNFVNLVKDAIGTLIGKLVDFARNTRQKVDSALDSFGFLRQSAARVRDVVVGVFTAITNAIQGAIDRAQSLINKLNEVRGRAGAVKGGSGLTIGGGSKKTVIDPTGGGLRLVGRVGGTEIGRGLSEGLAKSQGAVNNATDKVVKNVKDRIAKLRGVLATAKSDFASLVEPIASNFTQGLFDFDTAGAFTANLTAVKGTLTSLLGNFKTLIANGLSPGFLYQLFQSGGPGLISGLAALPKDEAQSAGALFGQVTSLADELGGQVAGATDRGLSLINEQKKTNDLLTKMLAEAKKNPDKVAEANAQPHKRARRRAVRAA